MSDLVKCKTRGCGNEFVRHNSLQNRCFSCMANIAKKRRENAVREDRKRDRAKHRADKERVKTRAQLVGEAQGAFNRYIRLRDKGKPCISCDRPDDGSHQRHASHYRPAGIATALRFSELNVHASCAQCNSMKSGNLVEYRIRLVRKIGQRNVEWLESQNATHKWDLDDLKVIKAMYAQKSRDLKKRIDNHE